mmetsp:Transcript_70913/g.121820  ORF Transcript_70913/g.121820 Transcript_70913/m.121820 type:complete len:109 (+) Transcript_70913:444-770(+)
MIQIEFAVGNVDQELAAKLDGESYVSEDGDDEDPCIAGAAVPWKDDDDDAGGDRSSSSSSSSLSSPERPKKLPERVAGMLQVVHPTNSSSSVASPLKRARKPLIEEVL